MPHAPMLTCSTDLLSSRYEDRYLPKFENGVAVSVPGVRTKITFDIR